jgi:hypothetical protein
MLGILRGGRAHPGRHGTALQHFFHTPLAAYIPWVAAFTALSVPVAMLPVTAMVDRRSGLVALLVAGFGGLQAAALVFAASWTRDLTVLLAAALVGLSRDKLHAFYVGTTMTAAQFAVYAGP